MDTIKFEMFRGVLASYETLFRKAARFASGLKAGKLVSISHSSNGAEGIVTVWYRA